MNDVELIFKHGDNNMRLAMEREQMIVLGKRIYEAARDLRNRTLVFEVTADGATLFKTYFDPNGNAPAFNKFDPEKVKLANGGM